MHPNYVTVRDNQFNTLSSFALTSQYAKIYNPAPTLEVYSNALRKTGLVPCNPNIFHNYDFAVYNATFDINQTSELQKEIVEAELFTTPQKKIILR